ncbi:MAG: glycosyl transferase family 28, partial [Chitinophagales bacterium]|nr:glycosyl transferase family 28 [Chitinophagales bacterium]
MQKTVLLCVLNWGLGHAARCVPIIEALIKNNAKVVVASDGEALHFLQKIFPDLTFEKLPPYDVSYSSDGILWWAMAKQIPGLIKTIQEEARITQLLIKKYRPSLIISDNRYGCRSKEIFSVFICHQLHIQMPSPFTMLQNTLNLI